MKTKMIFTLVILFSLLNVDAQTNEVSFKIKNMGFNVKGIFEKFNPEIVFIENDISKSTFNGTIMVSSINTDSKKRDSHLKEGDYFDAVKYPTILFKSTSVGNGGNSKLLIKGDLTIKNTTKEVSFTVNYKKINGKYEFMASLPLNRRDYGVGGSSFILSDKLVIYVKIAQ